VLMQTLGAKSGTSGWNANTGKLKVTLKRPSQIYPELGLTETVEVTGLLSSDKPGASDERMLWVSSPGTRTADESTAPRLNPSGVQVPCGTGGALETSAFGAMRTWADLLSAQPGCD